MSVTQADAVNWLNSQVGQHLDYDKQYGQQCFDFFNYYYQYITGDGPYADGYAVPAAKQIWDIDNSRFTKIPDSNSLLPQPGDIAVYGAAWGNGDGHVEVVLATDSNGCTLVGENEHNDPTQGVVTVYRTWSQMRGLLGVMRPSWDTPPTPAAAPVYTIVGCSPQQFTVKPNMSEWNLSLPDFTSVQSNPFTNSGNGLTFTAVATLTRPDAGFENYTYYLPDAATPIGWNALDIDAVPVTPPTPPSPPAAPVTINYATTPIKLVTVILGYPTAVTAASRTSSNISFQPGAYVQFQVGMNGMLQIAKTADAPIKYWINPADNTKIPPKPATTTPAAETTDDVIKSFKWFFASHEPVSYKVLKPLVVRDQVRTGVSINVPAGKDVEIYGVFKKGGVQYLRPFTSQAEITNQYYFYGIPTTDIYSGAPNLTNEFDTAGLRIKYGLEAFLDKSVKSIEGIYHKLTNIGKK